MNLTKTSTGRRLLFALLYLAEGAPIGFIWWVMPTVLRAAGAPVDRITALTAAVALPWALKFLWAPLVDGLRFARWGYRYWIVAAQLVMAVTLIPLMLIDPAEHLTLVGVLLLTHALAAATQDVAIDAWAIRLTPEAEHGGLNASMQTGMLAGRWLFGAGVLLAAAYLTRAQAIGLMIYVLVGAAAVVLMCEEAVPIQRATLRERWRTLGEHLRRLVTGRVMWIGLAIALTSGAAYEAVGIVVGPQLIDRGYEEADVGGVLSGTLVAMLAGVWIGGRLGDRFGHRRAMIAFTVLLAAVVAALAGLHTTAPTDANNRLIVAGILAMYVGVGMFVAASYAMFMDLTDAAVAGTQFSAFMAATNACEIWSGKAVGELIGWRGYPTAFVVMAALSLIGVGLLVTLGRVRAAESAGPAP